VEGDDLAFPIVNGDGTMDVVIGDFGIVEDGFFSNGFATLYFFESLANISTSLPLYFVIFLSTSPILAGLFS